MWNRVCSCKDTHPIRRHPETPFAPPPQAATPPRDLSKTMPFATQTQSSRGGESEERGRGAVGLGFLARSGWEQQLWTSTVVWPARVRWLRDCKWTCFLHQAFLFFRVVPQVPEGGDGFGWRLSAVPLPCRQAASEPANRTSEPANRGPANQRAGEPANRRTSEANRRTSRPANHRAILPPYHLGEMHTTCPQCQSRDHRF